MENKVNLALISSGDNADARAIMQAYKAGKISNVNLKFLISTKLGAPCTVSAKELGILSYTIDRQSLGRTAFNERLAEFLIKERIQLCFLVGCLTRVPFVLGVAFYNVHPADPKLAGGPGMYGLKPHKEVLLNMQNWVDTKLMSKHDDFYTYPTVHRVASKKMRGAQEEYDSGEALLRFSLRIPKSIIRPYLEGTKDLEATAVALQKYVLSYLCVLLPLAVEITAKQILDGITEELVAAWWS